MTDVVVDRLRIRGGGPHGRRLAGIAARLLPDALERACADLPDARLGRLVVALDLDPAEYDDETLATLWASRIRVAAIDAGARPVPRAGPVPRATGGGAQPAAPPAAGAAGLPEGPRAVAHALAAVRGWLASGRPPAGATRLLRVLGSPVGAAAVLAGLRPEESAALLALLGGARPAPGGGAAGAAVSGAGPAVPQAATPGPGRGAMPAGSGAATGRASVVGAQSAVLGAGGAPPPTPVLVASAAAALLADPAPPAVAAGTAADVGSVTTVAGLALLYPWLAEHCERARALHPALDPVAVRRLALALLADPGQPWLVADPLVLLLAGAAPATAAPATAADPSTPLAPLAPLDAAAEVERSAERVLASFAALLPGFARSTPAFVRAEWVARIGDLAVGTDPVRLVAQRRPLDLVLSGLPYPLGLLRLAWSPVVAVRFAP